MKCIMYMKQVPDIANVEVNPVTRVLKRDRTQSKLNPYDLYAMESAFGLKEQLGGTMDVITMGPGQAREALRECIYMGADRAGLISDRKFTGADVVATSYTLSQGVRRVGEYDLVLCGKQTTNGDTAQVGPEVAQWLGILHAFDILEIRETGERRIQACMNMDGYEQIQAMDLLCLITMNKDVSTPRLPSYKREKELQEGYLREFSLTDLEDQDESHYGLSGSPTQVEHIFPPEKSECRGMFDGSPGVLADKIHHVLRETKFMQLYRQKEERIIAELRIHQEQLDEDSIRQLIDIRPFGAISCRDGKVEIDSGYRICRLCVKKGPGGAVEYMETQEPGINKDEWRAVAAYVEYNGEAVRPVASGLIGKARELAAVTSHPVYALFIGCRVGEKAEKLLAYGVGQIFVHDGKELEHFSVLTYANVFVDFITRIKPSSILVGATNAGRFLAPRVAVRFRTGLTVDCVVLEMKGNTDLVQIRPAFGGDIMTQAVMPKNWPQFCMVRYKIFSAPPVAKDPSGTVRTVEVTDGMVDRRIRVEEIIRKPKEIDIPEAEVIMAVGRDVKSQAGLELIRELAIALDAQLACTRPLIECGWFDARRQIGLSGRTVKPKLIITIGISGSARFAADMRGAECIIAVNTDRKAPVFDIANIGLVGDWYEILPRLLKTVKEGMWWGTGNWIKGILLI